MNAFASFHHNASLTIEVVLFLNYLYILKITVSDTIVFRFLLLHDIKILIT